MTAQQELPSKGITRRGFIVTLPVAATAVALLAEGCAAPENWGNLEITQARLEAVTRTATNDYNKVLGFNFSPDEIASKVKLVDITEYHSILSKAEEGYVPQDETERPAITFEGTMYFYRGAFDAMVRNAPNNQTGKEATDELLEYFTVHELSHLLSAKYESPELDAIVFDQIYAGVGLNKNRTRSYVEGAEVHTTINGINKSTYQNLEEAEAIAIGTFVMNNRGKAQLLEYPPYPALDGVLNALEQTVFSYINRAHPEQALIHLAQLRTQVGGREQWATEIGDALHQDPPLLSGMLTLASIDVR